MTIRFSVCVAVSIGSTCVLLPSDATHAQPAFNTVALSGEPAPGVSDGAVFSGFINAFSVGDGPALNASGDVALRPLSPPVPAARR